MCCGGKRVSAVAAAAKSASVASLPGAKEGMVILEYAGKNSGNETWRGPVTQQVYVIGGVNKRSYVDKRDAGQRPTATSDGKGMLSWRENDRWLFRLYEPPVEIKTVVEAPPTEIVETVSGAAINKITTSEVVITSPALNPDELSVSKLKAALKKNYYSQAEILEALEIEQGGQNRKSAIDALENALL